MLKFVKHHMDSIDGIEIYPLISFIIFFVFFALLLVYVFTMSKEYVHEMSDMPLHEDEEKNTAASH